MLPSQGFEAFDQVIKPEPFKAKNSARHRCTCSQGGEIGETSSPRQANTVRVVFFVVTRTSHASIVQPMVPDERLNLTEQIRRDARCDTRRSSSHRHRKLRYTLEAGRR